jgi:hypothetical protein
MSRPLKDDKNGNHGKMMKSKGMNHSSGTRKADFTSMPCKNADWQGVKKAPKMKG